MTESSTGTPAPPTLWRAFLLRATVAGAFGLLTIFWGQPSVHVMSVVGGLYFLGLAIGSYLTVRSVAQQNLASLRLAVLPAALLAAAGLLNLVVHSDSMFALTGAVALIASGAVELLIGVRNRRRHIAARDFMLVGSVSVLTGALLPLFASLGAHALLGVAGGGAVITAVVLALAALSYRHDARQALNPQAPQSRRTP